MSISLSTIRPIILQDIESYALNLLTFYFCVLQDALDLEKTRKWKNLAYSNSGDLADWSFSYLYELLEQVTKQLSKCCQSVLRL